MNIPSSFRLRDAFLALSLALSVLCPVSAFSQEAPAKKTEMPASMRAERERKPSTVLSVTLDDKSLTLSPSDLAAMPHESVTVINGHTKVSESYSGVPIAAILEKAGLAFTKANEHILLKTIVVAEGTDGYRVVLSAYESLAAIRGQSALVADALAGKPLEKDGVFKLVVPGDTRPQRWVQNLKSLTFKTVY